MDPWGTWLAGTIPVTVSAGGWPDGGSPREVKKRQWSQAVASLRFAEATELPDFRRNDMSTTRAVYVVEYQDRFCGVRFVDSDSESSFVYSLQRKGAVWFERICAVDSAKHCNDEELLLANYCTRTMISLFHHPVAEKYYLARDYASALLASPQSVWGWKSSQTYGANTVLRFGPSADPELVIRPFDDKEERYSNPVCMDLYIYQDAIIGEAYTLSIDKDDERYSEYDWQECLGSVEANWIGNCIVEVSLDEINHLVARCSRPMLPVSASMPPMYVSREWLEDALARVPAIRSVQ